ncbi:MAG: helix-turn-helix domain-containing protein [Oscillospiraceae bacterium]|nr:helix-turn-helix domain-containing protein [Oscillospiraceae bacterium]
MLLYTDKETALRLLEEISFEEMALRPAAAWDRKTAEGLAQRCQAALVDLDLPDGGILAGYLREKYPGMPVITFSEGPADGELHCESRRSAGIVRYICRILQAPAVRAPGRELFWRNLLRGLVSDPFMIRKKAVRFGISPEDRYTVVRVSVFDRLQFGMMEWLPLTAVQRTALTALLTAPELEFEVLTEDRYNGHYWLVLKENEPGFPGLPEERCALFDEFCRKRHRFVGLCRVSGCTVIELAGAAEQIGLACQDAGPGLITDIRRYAMKESGYCSGAFREKFRLLLAEKGAEAFAAALREELDRYETAGSLDHRLLRMMLPDLEYLLRESFAEKDLDVPSLMESPYCLDLRGSAFCNRGRLERYLHSILQPAWNRFPASVVYPDPVRRIMEYLEENLTAPYSRENIGRAIGLNPNYLAALFKESTGQSISAWRGKLQMERAVKLLTGTKLSIGQVAEQSGFGDPGYFNNAFRKQYGMPPGEYRQKHRRK